MKILIHPALTEQTFEALLPENVRIKSKRHFTPEPIINKAAHWLVGEDKRKVLDIGAGVGKFCLFGAQATGAQFIGIEVRLQLVNIANDAIKHFGVEKANVILGNIMDFNFSEFSAFYFYNPFQENLAPHLRLDSEIHLAHELYYEYTHYTCLQLSVAPKKTRIATYYGSNFDIPQSYTCVQSEYGDTLKFWVKED